LLREDIALEIKVSLVFMHLRGDKMYYGLNFFILFEGANTCVKREGHMKNVGKSQGQKDQLRYVCERTY